MALPFNPRAAGFLEQNDPASFAKFMEILQLEKLDAERELYENSLLAFFERAWREIEAAPLSVAWFHEEICKILEAVTFGEVRDVIINVPPRHSKSLLVNVIWPAWCWTRSEKLPLSGPHVKFLCVSYGATLAEIIALKMFRLVSGVWYQSLWGERVKLLSDQSSRAHFANSAGGERISSSVESGLIGRGGDVQILDDVHNLEGAESDAQREATLRAVSEGLPTRITDPRISARVLVMQRLHTMDATSWCIENWRKDLVHLMYPARFDPDRACPSDHRTEAGELLWPEMWDEEALRQATKEMNEYACTPAGSPILMADLTLKPIEEVKIGDEIVGMDSFHSLSEISFPEKPRRRKLQKAIVTNVFSYKDREIVALKMKSGSVVRCTPDHFWYNQSSPSRKKYKKAGIGGKLAKICDMQLPILTREEERWAGWLGGFFDGEGTVSLCKKWQGTKGYRPTAQIHFYQGSGRNLILCAELERVLNYFGFEFSYWEDERKENKTAECYGYRTYTLTARSHSTLTLFQRFLHIVKPLKWRQRLIDGAYGARFIREWDRIEDISPAGIETVYALETTTGNYVVSGYASSNSAGQFQQMPVPRGGGIIKREWWQPWPPIEANGTFADGAVINGRIQPPAFEYIVAWVDTAFTEKNVNDPSAMTVWGVFRAEGRGRIDMQPDGTYVRVADDWGYPKVMLIFGWAKRLPLHGPPEEVPPGVSPREWNGPLYRENRQKSWGLVEWVVDTCKRYKVDHLGIETQGGGLMLEQELRRLHSDGDWGIETVPARKGKFERLQAVSHLWSAGQIYAPTYEDGTHPTWCEPIIDEITLFPRGKRDDLTDTASGALAHLRSVGIFERREEFAEQELGLQEYSRNRQVPLPYGLG